MLLGLAAIVLNNDTLGVYKNYKLEGIEASDLGLLHWFRRNGGRSKLIIGKECDRCPRGMFASQNIHQGDIAISVPLKIAVKLKDQELAYHLVLAAHSKKIFNATFPFFWSAMPPREDVFDISLLAEHKLRELQNPSAQKLARERLKVSMAVYNGKLSTNSR